MRREPQNRRAFLQRRWSPWANRIENKLFAGIDAGSEQPFSANIDDVDIRDDFMFSYVMQPPDLHGTSARLLPDHKISRIEYYEMGRDGTEQPEVSSKKGELKIDTQKALNEAFNKRTVWLTCTSTTESPCTTSRCRPRGMRVYCGSITRRISTSTNCGGQYYTRLRPSFVIFICTFDPFDEGRYLYSFRNVCRETGAELGDEATSHSSTRRERAERSAMAARDPPP